ncbi:MAG TPA: ABC-F family ATP-binding cassette domain-containing protein [Anaerolineaceae bacterium]
MLTVHSLTKSFELKTLFEKVSFSLNPGERVGLIGPNGCGKTTLLRILTGEEPASGGTVTRDQDLRLGYLPQGFAPDPSETVGVVIGRAAGNVIALEDELSAAALALANRPGDPALGRTYDDLLRRIEFAEGGRAQEILAGLGLDAISADFPVGKLSGGQKTRLALALVLLGDPQLLLLDEPTNHLDIGMLEWLEDWLNQSPIGALVISHDRTFLDHTVTRILDLDPQQHTVRQYAGNYSDYLAQRQIEIEKQQQAYADQQMEIRRMKQDIARTKAQAAHTERMASSIRIGGPDYKVKGFKSYQQGIAKKVAKKASSREKKLERYLDDDSRVERPQREWQIKFAFGESAHLGRMVILAEGLSVGYSIEQPLLEEVSLHVQAGQRIAITGPNGAGKTTLLRTLLGEIPLLGGELRLGPTVRLGYMSQDQSSLDPAKSALETIQPLFANETEARRFLAGFQFQGDEPLKPNALLSYGQRARLMLALLVAGSCNCLLLDEPINHLDIPSRTQFEQALSQFDGAVLAIVHDRYFIERFADEIWWVGDGVVTKQILK